MVALGSAGCVVRGVGGGVGGVGGGGGALSVGSGGVCRLADSRLACFARCYQVAAFCMACNVLYHCKHLILLFGFSPYLGKYNIFVCATLISQVRLIRLAMPWLR